MIICKGITIITVQTVLCAKPHKSFAILQNAVDRGLGKSVTSGEMFKIKIPFLTQVAQGKQKSSDEYHSRPNTNLTQLHSCLIVMRKI